MSGPGDIRVWSETKEFRRKRDVVLIREDSRGEEYVCEPLTWRICTNQLIGKPTLDDGAQFLQAVLDHAWSLGMRPAGFSDVPLQVAALKDHLQDMRALVFQHPQLILARAVEPDLLVAKPRAGG